MTKQQTNNSNCVLNLDNRQKQTLVRLSDLHKKIDDHLGLGAILGGMNTNEPCYNELDKLHQASLRVNFMLTTFNLCYVCKNHKNHSYKEHLKIVHEFNKRQSDGFQND